MSRNFELLQNLGKDIQMFSSVQEKPTVVALEMGEVKPPQFDLEPAQRDELMKLVQRVFLSPGVAGSHMVTVCGLETDCNSAWICARAGEILAAQVTGTVCVVDANLRQPGLHQEFGVDDGPGLANALRQPDSIRNFVRTSGRPNLWLLSSGEQAQEWEALVASDRMRARLIELRGIFDYVLIDAPALSASNDVTSLARASEGVVLVLKAHSSRREVARKAVKDFGNAGVRVLGAVLNQRTFPIPDKIYSKL